jgi:hypothetical protein
MPAHIPFSDVPASASPIIISESPTHVVIAVEVSRSELERHRRFLESLLAAARPAGSTTDG